MMKQEIGVAMTTQLDENLRVSVVKWSDTEYNCRVYYNMYPNLNPEWQFDGSSFDPELLVETELESDMQVYRFIEDSREMVAKFGGVAG